MNKWAIMHEYRRAVANGKASAIKCPDCNSELVPIYGRDEDPSLKCLSCRTVFEPGVYVWDQIIKALREIL